MMSIVNYLNEHQKYEHDVMGRAFMLEMDNNNIVLKVNGDEWLIESGISAELAIQEILEEHNIEIRFCEECGKPMDEGFMIDDGSFYSCEECFESVMDNTYGRKDSACRGFGLEAAQGPSRLPSSEMIP